MALGASAAVGFVAARTALFSTLAAVTGPRALVASEDLASVLLVSALRCFETAEILG